MKKMMKILVVFGFIMINSYAHCDNYVKVHMKFPNKSFMFRLRVNGTNWYTKTWFVKQGTTTDITINKGVVAEDFSNHRYQVKGYINGKTVYISANPKILRKRDKEGHFYKDWQWFFDDKGWYHLSYLDPKTNKYVLKEKRKVIK
jgi:hypothetical protein